MSLIETVVESVSENLKTLLIVGGGYVAAVEAGVEGLGYPAIPSLPGWWQLGAVGVGAVAVVGWQVGDKLAALLPDPRENIIVAQEAGDGSGGAIYELNEEAWEQLHVKEGELYPWSASPHDVYEAWRYNPETNVAVANWRGEKPASEYLSDSSREEIQRQIREDLRVEQRQSRYYRAIRQALPSIVRRLDKRRLVGLNRTLEGHISQEFGEDAASIDEIINERVPDEAVPDYMKDDEEQEEDDDVISVDVLDDVESEALDPTVDLTDATDPIQTDGGER